MPRNKDIEAFVAGYSPEVQVIVEAARTSLRELLPGVTETLDRPAKLIGFEYGPGYTGVVFTLLLTAKGAKIGIGCAANLPDPKGLLKGSGKLHKHVPLNSPADLRTAGLKPLLTSAFMAWKIRTGAE